MRANAVATVLVRGCIGCPATEGRRLSGLRPAAAAAAAGAVRAPGNLTLVKLAHLPWLPDNFAKLRGLRTISVFNV